MVDVWYTSIINLGPFLLQFLFKAPPNLLNQPTIGVLSCVHNKYLHTLYLQDISTKLGTLLVRTP